jgi:ubiquinone/menaquinone biosynthesis C-methylase UbiE
MDGALWQPHPIPSPPRLVRNRPSHDVVALDDHVALVLGCYVYGQEDGGLRRSAPERIHARGDRQSRIALRVEDGSVPQDAASFPKTRADACGRTGRYLIGQGGHCGCLLGAAQHYPQPKPARTVFLDSTEVKGTMPDRSAAYFDTMAAEWDDEPRRVELMKAVGRHVLRQVHPTNEMDVLDYGCGTGLLGLYLLPHVRSVTGADSSEGMLEVLREKITKRGVQNVRTLRLNLEQDDPPNDRYDLIVVGMALHHITDIEKVLRAFFEMLRPGGFLCVADLDTEPGTFHGPNPEERGVRHFGFDREQLKSSLARIGFRNTRDANAHTIRKPIEGGEVQDFSVFLIVAQR